jgi:hypothetical protein
MGAKDTFLLSPVDERAPIQQLDFLLEILGNSGVCRAMRFLGVRVVGIFFISSKVWQPNFADNGGGKQRSWVFFGSEKLAELPEGRWINSALTSRYCKCSVNNDKDKLEPAWSSHS